jgi:RNA polymerase sigma-70 factor (ECF subfamily)
MSVKLSAVLPGVAGGPRRPPGRAAVDERVRARFREGDPDAARAVYRTYGSLVYAVAFKVLGERGLCEEATQQTFVKAWRAAASVDPTRELGPWLATIARRVAIDLYRREARRAASPLDSVAPDDPALASLPATAEDCYVVWEVRRAVSGLPAEERDVVRLQHFEGLTHEQVAQRLGIPVGTVKSRSYRAHKRLANELGHLQGENQPAPRTVITSTRRISEH